MMSDAVALVWRAHDDVDACARALGEAVAQDLRAALEGGATVTLALSGGSTPRPFLEHLTGQELDWTRVEIYLVDERWCDHDDARSNHGMIARALSGGGAREARLVPLWRPGHTLAEGGALAAAEVAAVAPLDVLVLGMGEDGHTASWIPGAEGLDVALDDAIASVVPVVPTDGREPRLTMSRSAVTSAKIRYLHLTGAAKRRVLEQAIAPGPWETLPIRAAFKGTSLRVYWSPGGAR